MQRASYKPGDYYQQAPPRTIGAECEYDLHWPTQETSEKPVFSDYINPETLRAIGLHPAPRHINTLSNGSLAYVDMKYFTEIASAEAAGPRQAVLTDFAGGVLLDHCVGAAGLESGGIYRRSGFATQPYTYTGTGYHENYLLPAELDGYGIHLMAAHFATRVWAGGGLVDTHGYSFSQKAKDVSTMDNFKATDARQKSMVNQHRFYDYQPSSWRRLENRCADPLRSPIGRFAAFGSTSLVLRLIEHNALNDLDIRMLPDDPIEAFHACQSPYTLSAPFKTGWGHETTALATQQYLIDMVVEMAKSLQLPADELEALAVWQSMVDAYRDIEADATDTGRAAGLTDGGAKLRLLTNRYGAVLTNETPIIVKADMDWDDITRPDVPAYWNKQLDRHPFLLRKQLGSTAVEHYVLNPPNQTSAKERGLAVSYPGIDSISWSSYKVTGENKVYLSPAPRK